MHYLFMLLSFPYLDETHCNIRYDLNARVWNSKASEHMKTLQLLEIIARMFTVGKNMLRKTVNHVAG